MDLSNLITYIRIVGDLPDDTIEMKTRVEPYQDTEIFTFEVVASGYDLAVHYGEGLLSFSHNHLGLCFDFQRLGTSSVPEEDIKEVGEILRTTWDHRNDPFPLGALIGSPALKRFDLNLAELLLDTPNLKTLFGDSHTIPPGTSIGNEVVVGKVKGCYDLSGKTVVPWMLHRYCIPEKSLVLWRGIVCSVQSSRVPSTTTASPDFGATEYTLVNPKSGLKTNVNCSQIQGILRWGAPKVSKASSVVI